MKCSVSVWVRSVSYTHLDVYKRQAQISGSVKKVVKKKVETPVEDELLSVDLAEQAAAETAADADVVEAPEVVVAEAPAEEAPAVETPAVSYTHLDVYKRQLQ